MHAVWVEQVLTALHLVLAKMSGEKAVQETMLSRCGAQKLQADSLQGVGFGKWRLEHAGQRHEGLPAATRQPVECQAVVPVEGAGCQPCCKRGGAGT